ncbi:MAG TPA: hypothetical protein VGQ35_02505, partial [Dongiaceae bacterium]|nr:hypothetical protein [Dongiaceae bacterium]
MKFVDSQRAVLIFLGITTLIALGVVLGSGREGVRVLDVLTGIVAAVAAFVACARLTLGTPNAAARRGWQVALALLGLICLNQFADLFSARATTDLAVNDATNLLLVAAALALLLLAARFDPMPPVARVILWLALAVQLAGVVAAFAGPAEWIVAADFLALISIQLYLLGTVWFVASVCRDLFVIQHRASDVGDFARYLYATSGLFKKVRHPRIGNYTLPGHKLAFVLVRLLSWFPTIAPRVRDKFGVGLWHQFRDLCVVAIRHGLDAQVYYMFELYRSERRARTSGYLTRYEMKNGLYK